MYHLFCGQRYYPEGGIDDFAGSFPSVADAIKFAFDHGYGPGNEDCWFQIADANMVKVLHYADGKQVYPN